MSDDTPTQRFDTPGPEGDGDPEKNDPETKKSRTLMIALIIVGAVLLIAIIILVVVLAARGSGSPQADPSTSSSASTTASDTASQTPSATPTPTPTPTATQTVAPPPPPPSNNPVINSFTSGTSVVLCNTSAPQGDHQYIGFTWSSSKAAKVYFGVNTNDASTASLFDNLPASGNSNDDFPDGYNHGTYEYPCTALSTKFTLTVVGDNGHKASKSITIENHGDH